MAARWLITLGAVAVTALGVWLLVVVRSATTATTTDAVIATPLHASADTRSQGGSGSAAATIASAGSHGGAARAARETLVERFRDPRPNHERWSASGTAILDRLAGAAQATSDEGCYMAGCMATFTFASDAASRDAIASWRTEPEVRAWTGGIRITDPEVRSDGGVVTAVLLDRPN